MIKGYEIATAANSHEGLNDYLKAGALRGVYLGFPMLHEIYTMPLPGCTDWTGIPQSGKSEVLLEMLLNTSIYYGWKHLLYVPDVGDKNEVLAILIHKLSGKTFDKRYQNLITESEVSRYLPEVLDSFKILVQTDLKVKLTPYEFYNYAAELKAETIGGIQTATIDSWKDMRHGVSPDGHVFGRDDKYLEDVLSYRNSMSERHKMHFHTIIHPIKTEVDASGRRKMPTPYDLKGGSEWYNNGKQMVSIHRVDGEQNKTLFFVTKAKPKSVAKIGEVEMYFDLVLNRFYQIDENNVKKYAAKEYVKPASIDMHESKFTNDSQTSSFGIDDDDDIPF